MGDGVFGQAGDGVDIELAHDALAMGLNRADANAEAVGDLLVEQPLGNQGEHLTLAVGQWQWSRSIGGSYDLRSTPGLGTEILVEVPIRSVENSKSKPGEKGQTQED